MAAHSQQHDRTRRTHSSGSRQNSYTQQPSLANHHYPTIIVGLASVITVPAHDTSSCDCSTLILLVIRRRRRVSLAAVVVGGWQRCRHCSSLLLPSIDALHLLSQPFVTTLLSIPYPPSHYFESR